MLGNILEQGEGIVRLAPNWVPRGSNPGKRLKLHPDDQYAYGRNRGAIIERWLSSTTKANNGPLTTQDEGLSYVVYGDESNPQKILLADLIDELGAKIIGEDLWTHYHRWPAFSKFFDNKGPLPFHMHHKPEHAAMVGAQTKPESYYFPQQLNNYEGEFPFTFFGLEPGTTKNQIYQYLESWREGNNDLEKVNILSYSRAYRLELGTGWFVSPGVLHAPGSLCTYEPQWASDIGVVFQSSHNGIPAEWASFSRNIPDGKKDDLDFIISLLDWDANTALDFKQKAFRQPVPVKPVVEMQEMGYLEFWISHGNEYVAAKELTIFPGRSVEIKDSGPYGLVLIQGYGLMDHWSLETPTLIRFGQLTNDEYFVSNAAATSGVKIINRSKTEPLVMLKHFGPSKDAPV